MLKASKIWQGFKIEAEEFRALLLVYKQRFRSYFNQLSISELSLPLESAMHSIRYLIRSLAIEVGFLHEVDTFAA